MSAYLIDWLSLLGRWVHLITGIAWIGASFYFVWLDNHLLPPRDEALSRQGVGGELWAVHGGGFYNSQKYRVAPQALPASLHWFYWEAYSTFLSGFFLLALLYYAQAEIYLIDPRVASLSKPAAIAIGVGALFVGWASLHAICSCPLPSSPAIRLDQMRPRLEQQAHPLGIGAGKTAAAQTGEQVADRGGVAHIAIVHIVI